MPNIVRWYKVLSVTSKNAGAKHMRYLKIKSPIKIIDSMPQLAPYAKNW